MVPKTVPKTVPRTVPRTIPNTVVKTVKTPDTNESIQVPLRIMVEISKDLEGRTLVDVVQTCPVGEDRQKCVAETENSKDKLMVALANERGVLVKPKIIDE